jgi:phospholipase C
MGQLQNIDHIVVLMLENRSFDCLLGKLYDKSASFDGLSGTEQNPNAHDSPILVWNSPGTAEATMRIPDPDPGELWTDINSQLFSNAAGPRPGQSPSMDGFVRNYLVQKQLNPTGTYDAKSVMHYFTSDQVPVLSTLAKQFAVCDRRFASAPCQTWPNRSFAHAATADRQENNNPRHFFEVMTIFNRLELAGIDNWKIYFHDFAQSHSLLQLFFLGSHFQYYRQFQAVLAVRSRRGLEPLKSRSIALISAAPGGHAWNINIRSPCWITNPSPGISRGRGESRVAWRTA